MLQDYKLGVRMLRKYPGLTIAGGLALAIAIGIGSVWYELTGQLLSPTIPLPEGDRIVSILTQNVLTNALEPRVAHDFLEWRRELRTVQDLGAFRVASRNVIVGNRVPRRIRVAELTATAFRTARVSPLIGRGLLDSDERPGAPGVIVLGYDLWQREFGGRDVVGTEVKVGGTSATVIGVMPEGFGYPFNYSAWTPLQLRASYGALEGGPLNVIGRLSPGVTRAQANAELRVIEERTAASLPATHEHLRSRVTRLAEPGDPDDLVELSDVTQLVLTNLPVLLVLIVACGTVGTLVYARTATREGEIAVRSALGASRARIVGQLFVEALVLAAVAASVGLIAGNRALKWGMEGAFDDEGSIPFWMTPGLSFTTMLYAGGLAVVCAAMLSILPALRATRARLQSHLANIGAGGATLRFGRVWTSAMIAQVALSAIAIPVAMDSVDEIGRRRNIAPPFPARDYVAARLDVEARSDTEAASAFEARRARTVAAVEQRLALEPGVADVAFADYAPGATAPGNRSAQIETRLGAGPAFDYGFQAADVGPRFFEIFDRPIVSGRGFDSSDWNPAAHTVIVNEAFVRGFQRRGGHGSPIGARLQYSDRSTPVETKPWFEIVGIVRDFGLDPNDDGEESPYVFHAAAAGAVSPVVLSVRMRGNRLPLIARLPVIAADIDAGISVQEARLLDEWIRQRHDGTAVMIGAQVAVTALVLFLSAMGIFSLMSVSVSRQTREIGLRTALGANPRHVLAGILSRAAVLMGSGAVIGGALVLLVVALRRENVALFAVWLGLTALVMLIAGLLACFGPARRALRIMPMEALREA